VLNLTGSVRDMFKLRLFLTYCAFPRRYQTWAKLDLSFVAEKKLEMGSSKRVGGRGSEKIRSDKFFTFFIELLLLFPCSAPPIQRLTENLQVLVQEGLSVLAALHVFSSVFILLSPSVMFSGLVLSCFHILSVLKGESLGLLAIQAAS